MQTIENHLLPRDFKDFVECLNKFEVEYLLIGGFAIGVYGYRRATSDFDIFINSSESNALRMQSACVCFGISKENIHLEMFRVPKMVRIGEVPFRIEIIKKLASLDFEYAFERKEVRSIGNVDINVISLDDLIVLKSDAIQGRDKMRDQDDLNFLMKIAKRIKRS